MVDKHSENRKLRLLERQISYGVLDLSIDTQLGYNDEIIMSGILKPLIDSKYPSREETDDARKVLGKLASRHSGVRSKGATFQSKELIQKADITGIIFPWMPVYELWWTCTAVGAIFTVFFGPYMIAFEDEPGSFAGADAWVELFLTLIFAVDILVNLNLAFYREEVIVFDRKEIFKEYFSRMFWVDLIGVFPFENVAIAMTGPLGENSNKLLYLSLLRLLRFVRLHRMRRLNDILQYSAKVSLLWFTLIRNFAAVLSSTHLAACSMYFIARVNGFGEDTWIGPHMDGMSGFDRYTTALYWSIVTFCTVGYGDFSPVNSAEMICGSFFMLLNIVLAAWIIGSITLLIVKGDEQTGEYRDSLETLHDFTTMHHFEEPFFQKLKRQLRLEFNNREIADEHVLKNFPSAVRRKILRKLYLQPLMNTQLLKGVRPQFVDAFLASCKVEIFSPGEEIVERGSILSDLFLLVGGIAKITTPFFSVASEKSTFTFTSDEGEADDSLKHRQLEAGEFIGEIGFFTESPQVDSVACLTVCKTLTMSQSAYQLLAQDHPGSVGKILDNLLAKVEDRRSKLPKNLSLLRVGSTFDLEDGYGSLQVDSVYENIERKQEALTKIQDLVKMHMSKQLDDQTTRLLFAASRGDTGTIALMCDQGFDPDSADYDQRTALMVAAMKGNTDAVKVLLEYKVRRCQLMVWSSLPTFILS